MMRSNLFLILPAIFAALYYEWIYCFFAVGIFIVSPLFHRYQIINTSSPLYWIFRVIDWFFAIVAFMYMYFYTYTHFSGTTRVVFYSLLSLVILFFWYGWRWGDYSKWHPVFHIIAPLLSSAILIAAYG